MKRINNTTQSEARQLSEHESPGISRVADEIGEADFIAQYGESLAQTLDLDTWDRGENLASTFERLDREVAEALQQEDAIRKKVREIVFPQIFSRPNAPKEAGVFQVTTPQLKATQAVRTFSVQRWNKILH